MICRARKTTRRERKAFSGAPAWRRLGQAGALAAAAGVAAPAWAGPEGATVAAGAASVSRAGPLTTVHQRSQSAVIDWRSFDIGAGETVRFIQPGASARALNRVNSARPTPTQIDGVLRANGIIYIVNPAGVVFGPTSSVDVGGILAAGGAISNRDFFNGRDRFTSLRGGVQQHGTIRAESIAALVGASVVNTGSIHVPQGTAVMAAGDTVTLGSPLGGVSVSLDRAESAAPKSAAVEVGGQIRASDVSLAASDMFALAINGHVDVSGQTGGSVTATAGQVSLGGTIDASGVDAGGTVLLGGDVQGGGATPTADRTLVKPGARIDASASAGEGGKVVVWADGHTGFFGAIDASGSAGGGFVEVSGLTGLTYGGEADVSSANGAAGTVLLDPTDIIIVEEGGVPATLEDLDDFDDPDLGPLPDETVVTVDTLRQLVEGGELVLKASRDIIIRADLSDFFLDALVLIAGRNIIAEAPDPRLPRPFIAPGGVVLAMANAGPGDLRDGSAPDREIRGEGAGGITAGEVSGSGPFSLMGLGLGGFPIFGEGVSVDMRIGAGFSDEHVGALGAQSVGGPGDLVLSARGRRDLGGPRGDIDAGFISGEGASLIVRDAEAATLGSVFRPLDGAAVGSLRVADQQAGVEASADELISISTSLASFGGVLTARQIIVDNSSGSVSGEYRSPGGSISISAAGAVSGQYDADPGAAGSELSIVGHSAEGLFAADAIETNLSQIDDRSSFLGGSSIALNAETIHGAFEAPMITVIASRATGEGGAIFGKFKSPGRAGRILLDGARIEGTVDGGGDLVFVARGASEGAIEIESTDPLSDFSSLTIALDNPSASASGALASISLPEGTIRGLSLDEGVFSIGELGDMSAAGGLDVTIELLPQITETATPATSFDHVAVSSNALAMADGRTLRLMGAGGLSFFVADGPLGTDPGAATGAFEVVAAPLIDPAGAMVRPGMISLCDVYTTGDQFYSAEGGTISANTAGGARGFRTGGGGFGARSAMLTLDGTGDTVIDTSGPAGAGAIHIESGIVSTVGAGLMADASSPDGASRADIRIDGPIDLAFPESRGGDGLLGSADLRLRGESISVAGDISVGGDAVFDLPVFESMMQGAAVLDLTGPGQMRTVSAGGDIIIRGGGPVRDGDAVILRSSQGVQLMAPNGAVIAENFAGILVEAGDFVIDTSGGEPGGDVLLSNVFVDTGGLRIASDGNVSFTHDGEPLLVIVRGTLDPEVDPEGRAIWIEAAELLQIAQLAEAGAAARVLFLAGHESLPAAEAPGGDITLQGAMISLVMNADSEMIVRSTGGNIAMFAEGVDVATRNDDPLQVIVAADGGDPSDLADPGRTVTFESLGEAPLDVQGLTVVQLVPLLHRMFNSDLRDPDRFDLDRLQQILAEIDALTAEIDALEAELDTLDVLSARAEEVCSLLDERRKQRSDLVVSILGADGDEGLLAMFDESFARQLDDAWEILRLSGGGESMNEGEHRAIEDRRDALGRALSEVAGFSPPSVKAARIEDLLQKFRRLVELRQEQIAELLEQLQSTRARIEQIAQQLAAIDDPLARHRLGEMRDVLAMCDQLIAKITGFQNDFAGFEMSLDDFQDRLDSVGGVFDETTLEELCAILEGLIALEPLLMDPMFEAMMLEIAATDRAKRVDLSRGLAINVNPATRGVEAVHASPDANPRPVRQELILSEADLRVLERMAIHARDLDQAERTSTTSGRGLFNDVPRNRIRSMSAADYEIAKARFDVRGVRAALAEYRALFLPAAEDPDVGGERQQQIRDELQAQTIAFFKETNAIELEVDALRQFIRENAPALDEDLTRLQALVARLDRLGMTQKEAQFSRNAVLELVRPASDLTSRQLEALLLASPPAPPETPAGREEADAVAQKSAPRAGAGGSDASSAIGFDRGIGRLAR